jgi:hypothetical protein
MEEKLIKLTNMLEASLEREEKQFDLIHEDNQESDEEDDGLLADSTNLLSTSASN